MRSERPPTGTSNGSRNLSRRDFLFMAAGVTGAVILPTAVITGCSTAKPSGGSAPKPTIKIAASRGLVSAPIWNVSNHADKHGFTLEISELFTYADQQKAAGAGQTGGATSGITNPAMMADQGVQNLRVIAGQVYGGQNLVMRTGVEVKAWKDLEGKAIGVVPGTYARILFLIAAEQGGANINKINLKNISAGATALQALGTGDVDGFVLFSPTTDQAVVEGKGYYPASLDIGASNLGPANAVIIANTDFLQETALATSFMKAYVASLQQMQQEADFLKLAVELAGVKQEVAKEAFKHLYFSEMIDVKALTDAAGVGPKFGFAKADLSGKIAGLIDFGPLTAATGKKPEALSGTPDGAAKMVRRL